MKDFVLVFKILFKNQNTRRISNNGKRKLPQHIVMLLCMLPLVLLLCVIFGFVAFITPNAEALSLVSNVIVSLVQLFTLFLTMFLVINTLYNSSDAPFLNTLPISHTAVFFAKFALCYLNTLALSASLMVLPLLTTAIVYAIFGGAMFYGYFALVFLIAIVAPILPLFIITLFSMPISYLGTFFKGRAVLKTVLTLLFYIAIMIGYLLIIYYVGHDGADDKLGSAALTGSAFLGLDTFAKVMYPNKILIDFCLGLDAGRNFGISFGISVGMVIVMLVLAMLFYRRINERKLESLAENSHGEITYKQSNVIPALMKNDFKGIIRNPNVAMMSFANILICPIITAIMYFASDLQTSADGTPTYIASVLKLSYLILYTLIFLGGANTMAILAYTREGHSFYLTKSLPISVRDSIKAKFALSLILPAIMMIIQVVLAAALYRLDVLSVILFLVCMTLAIVGASALHIYCDMRFGNVNWSSRQDLKQASQQNVGSIVVAVLVAAIGCVALIGGLLLAAYEDVLGGKVAVLSIFWSVLFALCAATFIAGILVLKFKAEPYYEQIGERKLKQRNWSRRIRSNRGGGNMLIK